jgi:hypothetical protein
MADRLNVSASQLLQMGQLTVDWPLTPPATTSSATTTADESHVLWYIFLFFDRNKN